MNLKTIKRKLEANGSLDVLGILSYVFFIYLFGVTITSDESLFGIFSLTAFPFTAYWAFVRPELYTKYIHKTWWEGPFLFALFFSTLGVLSLVFHSSWS